MKKDNRPFDKNHLQEEHASVSPEDGNTKNKRAPESGEIVAREGETAALGSFNLLFETDDESKTKRLDAFLVQIYPELSRAYFQKLIVDGHVLVNGKKVNKSFKLKVGDRIEGVFPRSKPLSIEPQDVKFDVIDQQKEFLIINKPAGLIVHPAKKDDPEPSLVSGLLYRFEEFRSFDVSTNVCDPPCDKNISLCEDYRPGIVHRIDKNTSGLLVVARNPQAHAKLCELFKERKVEKTYLAVVKGHPDREGTIDLPVGRHPVERNKMSHMSYEGKPATTHYKVLQYYKKRQNDPECALVSVQIETGRTHQIRVHFAAIGHKLLGDTMYGISSKLIKRQSLHAWKLSFEFQGKKYDYCCPVPDDFKLLLHRLKDRQINS